MFIFLSSRDWTLGLMRALHEPEPPNPDERSRCGDVWLRSGADVGTWEFLQLTGQADEPTL